MSLNINFSGYVYHHNGTIGNNDIYYRVYFKKINNGSSNSQWDTYKSTEGQTRKCENSGFFSFNLGDGGLLTQSGIVNNDDEVIVTFFIDENNLSNDDKDSCSLTEIGTYKWILTSDYVYTKDMQLISTDETINPYVKPSIDNWELNSTNPGDSSDGIVYSNYNYNSSNSEPVIQSEYNTANGGIMYHWWKDDNIIINDGFKIISREYDFDDGNGFQLLSDSGQYQWIEAGIKKCRLRLTTCFGNSNTSIIGTNDIEIKIYWRQPIPNIDCLESINDHILIPDTVVSFQYSGTDDDNRIININWNIEDGAYDTISNNHSKNDTIYHTNGPGTSWNGHMASSGAFGNPGNHNISISIDWDNGIDGTNTQIINFSKIFIQDVFDGPYVDFHQDPVLGNVNDNIDFINDSTNTDRVGLGDTLEEYDWEFNDNGNIYVENNKSYNYIFSQTPQSINVIVKLIAHWHDGFNNKITEISKNVLFEPSIDIIENYFDDATCVYAFYITGTSTGGGNPTGYQWMVYFEPDNENELIWTSPIDLNQQYKRFYFPKVGIYRIIGHIYGDGNETIVYKDIEITSVCENSCIEKEYISYGGAPPYRKDEYDQKPKIIVSKPRIKINKILDIIKITKK